MKVCFVKVIFLFLAMDLPIFAEGFTTDSPPMPVRAFSEPAQPRNESVRVRPTVEDIHGTTGADSDSANAVSGTSTPAGISCYQTNCTGKESCISTVLSTNDTCSTSNYCYTSRYESGQNVTMIVGCTSSCTENYVQTTNGATETYLKCCNSNLCNSDATPTGNQAAALVSCSFWSLFFATCLALFL